MTRPMTSTRPWLGLLIVAATAACGGARVPAELQDARTDYRAASEGQAAQVAPAELHVAKNALDKAEKAFKENGDERRTRDLAYIGHRKVLLAQAVASTLDARQRREEALAAQRRIERERLGQTRQTLEATEDLLAEETERRQDAETAAAEAMRKLEESKAVKREPRGVVITLSGTVLFASGRAEIMPSAHDRLGEVATAVRDQPGRIVVEGHTDSRGSAESNLVLSRLRAESVLTALAAGGVPRARMTAVGYGESRPVADNASAEGRANNRRVEIVIQPETNVTSR